ncbi:hypothetical protein J31TS4_09970 [Paenibacillus sp. J31TS4]|uniref:hypothetical protein n=1 Tax=Paenibacillus sp. J31TS4 TaxID=2807195 RepID=UPI001B0B7759|nr:hypothetical protein [Paenibacillus sp. J31TS4]GIP37717.1 hypothetical protein J31TS4_09970 [Paenibacillus sp. J31TS4]
MEEKDKLERLLSDALEQEGADPKEPGKEAVKRLPSHYEIRLTAQVDPIVEETKRYRQMAKEVDDRYEDYLRRAGAVESELRTGERRGEAEDGTGSPVEENRLERDEN